MFDVPSMPYCTACGTEVGANHSYCENCGADLTDTTESGVQSGSTSNMATQTITSARNISSEELKSVIQDMDNYDFEYFVADLWEEMGWSTEVSQASVDAGIDIIATKESPYTQKKVIQAKRYSDATTVGGPDIQQYASLKQQVPNTDSVIVVTSSSFTSGAESRAEELNVKLIDGDDIVAMVENFDAYDIVDEYLEIHESANATHVSETAVTQEGEVKIDSSDDEVSDEDQNVINRISKFNNWHWVSAVAGVGIYLIGSVDPTLFGIMIAVTMMATYMDIRRVRDQSDWSPRAWLYSIGILLGFAIFALPVYFFNRYRYA